MRKIVKVKDIIFDRNLFVNYLSGTVLDSLLCSYRGLPKGVNYMVIGDPGVGKTTVVLLSQVRGLGHYVRGGRF